MMRLIGRFPFSEADVEWAGLPLTHGLMGGEGIAANQARTRGSWIVGDKSKHNMLIYANLAAGTNRSK